MKEGLFRAGIALIATLGISTMALAGPSADNDLDGIYDVLDNCSALPNGPPFDCDTDNDGYGNYCDGDFDQSNSVNANDFLQKFLPDFAPPGLDKGTGTDMDCSGGVNANDFLQKFLPQFAPPGKPGKSGLHCAGSVPCDL